MQIDSTNPSKPQAAGNLSYLEKLMASSHLQTINTSIPRPLLDMEDETSSENDDHNFIPLTSEDKNRIYKPWQFSLIIKIIGRKMSHQILKQKLTSIWKPSEELNLVDLGEDFFLIKFTKEQNMLHVLHDGPWFVLNSYLSVQRWEPKFVASQAKISYTAI
ncbi:hypothetical protein BC332_09406 [Capsicum chinense]|nr:hypothetical protein BC332_09406 [Capsicum chinense]